ncbi:hypothetical protein T484DRAFT_1882673, partial [Baffinella frigidus]
MFGRMNARLEGLNRQADIMDQDLEGARETRRALEAEVARGREEQWAMLLQTAASLRDRVSDGDLGLRALGEELSTIQGPEQRGAARRGAASRSARDRAAGSRPQAATGGGAAGADVAGARGGERFRKHRYHGVEEMGEAVEGFGEDEEGATRGAVLGGGRGAGEDGAPVTRGVVPGGGAWRAATAGGKRQLWNSMLGCYAPCE